MTLHTPTACVPPSDWEVSLSIGGGFAGVARSATIDSRGAVNATDKRTGQSAESTLPTEQVESIGSMLCAALSSPGFVRPPPCADCFSYTLEISTAGSEPRRFLWNDISLNDDPAASLVQALRLILDELLQPA
jgi:hypothetical protein